MTSTLKIHQRIKDYQPSGQFEIVPIAKKGWREINILLPNLTTIIFCNNTTKTPIVEIILAHLSLHRSKIRTLISPGVGRQHETFGLKPLRRVEFQEKLKRCANLIESRTQGDRIGQMPIVLVVDCQELVKDEYFVAYFDRLVSHDAKNARIYVVATNANDVSQESLDRILGDGHFSTFISVHDNNMVDAMSLYGQMEQFDASAMFVNKKQPPSIIEGGCLEVNPYRQ